MEYHHYKAKDNEVDEVIPFIPIEASVAERSVMYRYLKIARTQGDAYKYAVTYT